MKRLVSIIVCFVAMALVHCDTGLGPEIIDAVDLPASAEEIPTEEGTQIIVDYSFPISEPTVNDDNAFMVDPLVDPDGEYGVELPIDDDSCDKETAEDVIVGEPVLAASKLSIIYTVGQVLPGDTDLLLCLKDIDYEIRGIDDPDDKMIKIKTEPDPDPPDPPTPTITAPTQADVNTAIGDGGNTNGIQPDGFNSFILPEFTIEDAQGDPAYSFAMVDESVVSVAFDPATRTVSLADGYSEVGSDVETEQQFTYSVTVDEETSSETYKFNDYDDGGIIDYTEFINSFMPVYGIQYGSINIQSTAASDAYLTNLLPDIITIATTGMDVTDPDDDTTTCSVAACDKDDDGDSNATEFTNGTNFLVAESAGTFTALGAFASTTNPRSVNTGDFTGNGVLDLVVSGWTDGDLIIFTGDGDGTFTVGNSYGDGVGSRYEFSAVGDVNGDGDLDILAVDVLLDLVKTLLGNGDGTFTDFVDTTVVTIPGAELPWRNTLCDLNQDGDLDLIVSVYIGNKLNILYGDGTGNFGAVNENAVGTNPQTVICADLNNDNILDLAVANNNSTSQSILIQDPVGTFTVSSTPVVLTGGSGIQAADFDNDGNIDLAASTVGGGRVYVFSNDGTGTFTTEATLVSGGVLVQVIAAADFDGDNDIDIALVNANTDDVSIFLNQGEFSFAAAVEYSVGDDPRDLAVGDFNGDGKIDIVVGNFGAANTIQVLQND